MQFHEGDRGAARDILRRRIRRDLNNARSGSDIRNWTKRLASRKTDFPGILGRCLSRRAGTDRSAPVGSRRSSCREIRATIPVWQTSEGNLPDRPQIARQGISGWGPTGDTARALRSFLFPANMRSHSRSPIVGCEDYPAYQSELRLLTRGGCFRNRQPAQNRVRS